MENTDNCNVSGCKKCHYHNNSGAQEVRRTRNVIYQRKKMHEKFLDKKLNVALKSKKKRPQTDNHKVHILLKSFWEEVANVLDNKLTENGFGKLIPTWPIEEEIAETQKRNKERAKRKTSDEKEEEIHSSTHTEEDNISENEDEDDNEGL